MPTAQITGFRAAGVDPARDKPAAVAGRRGGKSAGIEFGMAGSVGKCAAAVAGSERYRIMMKPEISLMYQNETSCNKTSAESVEFQLDVNVTSAKNFLR
ncbi:hypothetical protein [Pandoraea sp. NPDC087047]|uniref:hypothetical protein n=1 Tax=Pandoraea sp. NPDC087047 TaxID=3364390 RepID=UPI0037F795DC